MTHTLNSQMATAPVLASGGGEMPPPAHVAIIMDGNGRWAEARGLSRLDGHRQGVGAVRRTLEAAKDAGVKYLTLWAFSTENWKRPAFEVKGILSMAHFYLKKELAELHEKGVRIRFIGDRTAYPKELASLVKYAENLTRTNDVLHLTIAFNYGGRQDILTASRVLAARVQAGDLTPKQITEEVFSQALYTKEIPDPDLLIRTSGEQRISGYLLWQMAYTEFVFTQNHWPDFDQADFADAIAQYQQRERRYGTLG